MLCVYRLRGNINLDFYNKKTMEQLTAELAHEVKNPVALIKANIEYIQVNDTSGLYEKNYGIIKKELEKISEIVMDFIKLAKPVEADEKEIIFIYDMISEVIEEFDTPYADKKIQFELICNDEELKFYGEYSKMCIVFFNIFKNAVEAVGDMGNIKAVIERDKDYVVVSVIDDGTGISKTIEEEIGRPFLTTKEGGSGLGLPICRKIAAAHGGTFEIFNNEQKGCTARVKLPLI